MGKRIDVICTPQIKEIFVTAVRNYTDVAFPACGTDCAMVAREALLDSLAEFEREYAASDKGRSSYNKRLRAMVKEAIKLHYQLIGADRSWSTLRECNLLLDVAEGIAHDDAELAAARSADRSG